MELLKTSLIVRVLKIGSRAIDRIKRKFVEEGLKGRVAGHVIGNVFYVVFIDQEHRFYVTGKKHT